MVDFDIAFSTIHRSNNQYFYETLKSFKENTSKSYDTSFIVGNLDNAYLTELKLEPNFNITLMSEKEWDMIKDKGKCDKFNMNFYRCLTSNENKKIAGRLYLEDDIIFKKDWDLQLNETIASLKEVSPEFALSIYTPYNLSNHPGEIVKFDKGFYGTQGVYFTSGILESFANKIMNEGILTYRHMADILLQEFCIENNIPLYVMKESLVQHIGEESSIHNNTFHKATSFKQN